MTQPHPSEPSAGPGALAPAEFRRIASLLEAEAGIELSESKLPLVHARLRARLRSLGIASYRDYCDFLEAADGEPERLEMLSVLTTNITRFYREPHHFEFLRSRVIPDLARDMGAGRPVRVWCAGCATGEEPYTMALTFLAAVPDIARFDFRILATDIDPRVLHTAQAATYPARALSEVPQDQKARFFTCADAAADTWQVVPEARGLVTLRRLNLIAPWPFSRDFDIVMCRNVVIYFGADTKAHVWQRLVQQVRPGGWLFTGHSERLPRDAAAMTDAIFTTTYRRKAPDGPSRERAQCQSGTS